MPKPVLKTKAVESAVAEPFPARFLPLLLVLFAGSGCCRADLRNRLVPVAATGDRVDRRSRSASCSPPSWAALCLGSLALPRMLCARKEHPLRVYAKVEFGIAHLRHPGAVRHAAARRRVHRRRRHGLPAILFRALVCAPVPAAADVPDGRVAAGRGALDRDHTAKASPGWASSTAATPAGAVFGCLLAGFYLLRVFDMATATFVAAAINVAVGLVSLAIAARTRRSTPCGRIRPPRDRRAA